MHDQDVTGFPLRRGRPYEYDRRICLRQFLTIGAFSLSGADLPFTPLSILIMAVTLPFIAPCNLFEQG